ncbi:MAG TPA: hypothetical protein VIP11_20345 [Gemmatimonadaceae bacterium]
MIRRRRHLITAVLAAISACAAPDATAPRYATSDGAASRLGKVPGSVRGVLDNPGNGQLNGCTPRDPQYGTATIGPSGGELIVGSHRLVVPAGALTQTVVISGSSPTDANPTIYLEPHGLQFKKPAGLILDASNCTDVPDAVYINEMGVVSEPIPAIYSTWWRTVAAPIDHFSGYAVAF